jgi:hypothetical protein
LSTKMWPRSTRTFEHNSNNHNKSNNSNNYKSTVTIISIITIIKIIPARRATPCDAEVQVRQAAQPSVRRRQGRRGSGTAGRPAGRATPPGPTRCRGRGYCACGGEGRRLSCGRGRGSGERGGLLAAERRDGRGEAEGIPSLPGTEPICISPPPASRPPSVTPPVCRQGAIPELKPLELGEGREGPCEARGALWADADIPAGGAWGKLRSGQAWPLGASLAGKPCIERCKETPEAAPQRHRPPSADIQRGAGSLVTASPAHALRFAVRLH